jgi:hypothetical protein
MVNRVLCWSRTAAFFSLNKRLNRFDSFSLKAVRQGCWGVCRISKFILRQSVANHRRSNIAIIEFEILYNRVRKRVVGTSSFLIEYRFPI